MTSQGHVELFLLKCAVIESALRKTGDLGSKAASGIIDDRLAPYMKQFDVASRRNAALMRQYYELFYLVENDIRRLIVETLEAAHGSKWWDNSVPPAVRDEARKNREREERAGVSSRSEEEIDYTTFGQLGDIIRENWPDFAGMLSNQSAVIRVLSSLNMLRGTIAHCGVLADDEVDRLKLAFRDWFRVLQGPRG